VADIGLGLATVSILSGVISGTPHVALGSVFSFGQFALGGLAVALLLTPVFGLPDAAGSIIEMSFAGGHGTIAGMRGRAASCQIRRTDGSVFPIMMRPKTTLRGVKGMRTWGESFVLPRSSA
jgi:hypothetical protein